VERNTVLVYIRQSFTKDDNDKASPDRQRALAEEAVKQAGWRIELYEDAEGHKSGRFVNNRPGWLELKKRMTDPDVVAIVAYDLARLHRKGWRIGDLLDQLEQLNVSLIFTRPGGLVPEKQAKDRPAYMDDVDPAHLIEGRAVFPLDLLRRVAEVRTARTHEPTDS